MAHSGIDLPFASGCLVSKQMSSKLIAGSGLVLLWQAGKSECPLMTPDSVVLISEGEFGQAAAPEEEAGGWGWGRRRRSGSGGSEGKYQRLE